MMLRKHRRSLGSNPTVGSSINSTLGSNIRLCAIATRYVQSGSPNFNHCGMTLSDFVFIIHHRKNFENTLKEIASPRQI